MKKNNFKRIGSDLILCLIAPSVTVFGALVFDSKKTAWISLCLIVLACLALFLRFERKQTDAKKLILIAVMVTLSVLGRIVFTAIPGFKPITALAVITALYLGGEAGFLTGALSAVLSNFYFGQGPWTPFQIFAWGILGLIAGRIAKVLKKSRILLILYGIFSGILYSFLMDVYSVLWSDGCFRLTRYLAFLLSSAKFTAIYAVSNVVFLLLLEKPIGKILERICRRYGIENSTESVRKEEPVNEIPNEPTV